MLKQCYQFCSIFSFHFLFFPICALSLNSFSRDAEKKLLGVCLPGYGASAYFVFLPFKHIRFKGCEFITFFTPSINYKFGPINQNDGEFSLPIFGHSEGFPCPGRRDNEKMAERLSKSDGESGKSLQNYQN